MHSCPIEGLDVFVNCKLRARSGMLEGMAINSSSIFLLLIASKYLQWWWKFSRDVYLVDLIAEVSLLPVQTTSLLKVHWAEDIGETSLCRYLYSIKFWRLNNGYFAVIFQLIQWRIIWNTKRCNWKFRIVKESIHCCIMIDIVNSEGTEYNHKWRISVKCISIYFLERN